MSELRTQSRLASFIEACANTAIGFFISVTAQWFLFHWYGIKATTIQFVWLSIWMTVLSVVRSYCLRRMWNAEWWKRFKRNHETVKPSTPPIPIPDHINCRCVLAPFDKVSHERLATALAEVAPLIRTAQEEREWRAQYEASWPVEEPKPSEPVPMPDPARERSFRRSMRLADYYDDRHTPGSVYDY